MNEGRCKEVRGDLSNICSRSILNREHIDSTSLINPTTIEEPGGPRTPLNGEHADSFLTRMTSYFRTQPVPLKCVRKETERLASFAVFFSLQNEKLVKDGTKIETCLRRCISRMHDKHAMVFGGMMQRLNITRNIDFYKGFEEVSEELFREEINWSKIVALYAFGARLAQFCQANQMEDLLGEISDSLSRFSNEHLVAYIESQGGWESLCDVFPAENEVEIQMWNSLGLIAVGLATVSLILLLRK